MPYAHGSSKLLIYFHANAEDIVLSHDLLDYMRILLKINVVAVEYPGYSLYTERHQKRYKYSPLVNPTIMNDLKKHFIQTNQPKYEKHAQNKEDDVDLRSSVYEPDGLGFGCSAKKPLKDQIEHGTLYPYE